LLVSFLAGKAEDPLFPSFFGGWARKSCPSFVFVWQLVMRQATLTLHRVPHDSAAHDAELG
jgi:hypothetical protein